MASDPFNDDTVQFTHRDQLARIDQLLAEGAWERRVTRLAPWQLAMSGLTAGAAIFAAGAAFMKVFAG